MKSLSSEAGTDIDLFGLLDWVLGEAELRKVCSTTHMGDHR